MDASSITAVSTSAGVRVLAAPRKVDMVRWPSGVTFTRQRPLSSPTPTAGWKVTPPARISRVNTAPRGSSPTLPT